VSIEADPALGVPYGNDLQFPWVFGKWYLYVVPEGHFRILELFWWVGAQKFTHVCMGICGRVLRRDLCSFFYSRKGGAWMWLFPLCWQQQSRWRVLLLRAWCIHDKWDGRWRTQDNRRRRHWCLPQTLCPLGVHSSNGGIWGHGRGGMPFFFSDQGPLLKGGGDVRGEYQCKRALDFFCSYI